MKKTNVLTEIAVIVALGWILDFIQGIYSDFLPVFFNGGSVGIAMIAVIIIGLRRGPIIGLTSGLILGILDLIDGNISVSPLVDTWYYALLQISLDYVLAWLFVGFSGFMAGMLKNSVGKKRIIYLVLACFIGALGRYISFVSSGIFCWSVPSSINTEVLWGVLTYNFSFIFPSFILTSIVLVMIDKRQPRLLNVNN